MARKSIKALIEEGGDIAAKIMKLNKELKTIKSQVLEAAQAVRDDDNEKTVILEGKGIYEAYVTFKDDSIQLEEDKIPKMEKVLGDRFSLIFTKKVSATADRNALLAFINEPQTAQRRVQAQTELRDAWDASVDAGSPSVSFKKKK